MPAATDSAFARIGAGTALLTTLAVLAGALIGVAHPAGGADPSAVIAALVCAVVGSLVAPLLALVWATRRPAAAGGALAGFGAVCAALVVFDVDLLRRPIDANRFELLRPMSAAELSPAPGAYLVLIGHVLGVLAGILGALALQRASLRDGYGGSVEPELSDRSIALRAGGWWSAPTVAIALVLVATSFGVPWHVHDPVLVVEPVVESGGLAIAAAAVLGVVLLVGVAVALATAEAWTSAGLLVGIGATAFAMLAPRVAAGVDDGLTPTVAASLAALSCVALVVAGLVVPAWVQRRDGRSRARWQADTAALRRDSGRVTTFGLHAGAGALGVVTAAVVAAGALLPTLVVPAGRTAPDILADRLALVAAVVLALGSAWLLLSEFAAAARPAVGPLCAAAVLGATAVAQAALEGARVPGVRAGVGGYLAGVGVLLAAVTAVLIVVAGAAEREDAEVSESPSWDRMLLGVGGVAAASGVVAVALPLYRGAVLDATSFTLPWGWDTWGQAQLAVVAVGCAVVGARSRPRRAAALLAGAAGAMLVYLLAWPLTQARAGDPSPGPAIPFAIVAIVGFAVAAALAFRKGRAQPARTAPGSARRARQS